jgi:hypothetical protein
MRYKHQSYLYRQLEAGDPEENVLTIAENSPIGEIPATHRRPLTSPSPSARREAYREAIGTAPKGEEVTATHVEETVGVLKEAREPGKKKRVD